MYSWKSDSKECKATLECRKVKCEAKNSGKPFIHCMLVLYCGGVTP